MNGWVDLFLTGMMPIIAFHLRDNIRHLPHELLIILSRCCVLSAFDLVVMVGILISNVLFARPGPARPRPCRARQPLEARYISGEALLCHL